MTQNETEDWEDEVSSESDTFSLAGTDFYQLSLPISKIELMIDQVFDLLHYVVFSISRYTGEKVNLTTNVKLKYLNTLIPENKRKNQYENKGHKELKVTKDLIRSMGQK